jgi:hypothetical protein
MLARRVLTAFLSVLAAGNAFADTPPSSSVAVAVANGSLFAVTWNAVPLASQYLLWVTDSNGTVRHQEWHTAVDAGCGSGQASCHKVLQLALQPGPTFVWIRTWNQDGFGPWSPQYSTLAHFGQPRVYDAMNQFVGVLFGRDRVLVEYKGVPVTFAMNPDWMRQTGVDLSYVTEDCTGKAYSYTGEMIFDNRGFPLPPYPSGSIPNLAGVVGGWAYIPAGNLLTVSSHSSRYIQPNGISGTCERFDRVQNMHELYIVELTSALNVAVVPRGPFTIVR